VPFLIRGPGIPASVGGNPLVGHLDLTATICDAAGARTDDLDGRTLRELGNPDWRKRLLVEHPGRNWSMVRDERHVYMALSGESVEVYDMVEDPYQTQNVADTMDPRTKEELRQRLEALRQARGRAGFAAAEA
jgi:arylsulfatase A-like enzyme